MLFFTFIKGGGGHPLTGPPNLNGFLSIIRGGGGVKSLLTNVNKKMVFFNEGFPYLLKCLKSLTLVHHTLLVPSPGRKCWSYQAASVHWSGAL